ncbi:hypothetical protein HN587_06425 [Candidatus Woesearchaeota archaeon]|jgi:hypothetical protein|nr:hypothetical protein [Candidatus Woesearchaeota archaeon]
MQKITKNKQTKMIQLKLNKKFYSKTAINSTIIAFEKICEVKFTENNNYFKLNLKSHEPISNLELEFSNYALGLMK